MTDAASMTETEQSTEAAVSGADRALVSLCNELVDSIAAGRAIEAQVKLAASRAAEKPPPDWRDLGPLALGVDHQAAADPVVPDRAGHQDRREHCEICGSTRTPLAAGIDGPGGAWVCADGYERQCEARQLRRFPPRPDRIPEAALSALEREDEVRAARHRQQEPPAAQEETDFGEISETGAFTPPRDPYGRWQPPPPGPGSGWHHTLRNPQHRSHLLGNDPFMNQLYGRAAGPGRDAATAAHWGAESPQDGQQEASPAPELPDGELDDRGMYEAARGLGGVGGDLPLQPHPDLAASPQRPARPRDRYGRRRQLKYQGRR